MNRRQMAMTMALGGTALAVGQRTAHEPSALAGGWASLELINPLQVVVVGVPVVVDAQMLQHGAHPSAILPGAIRFVHEETGEELVMDMEVISDAYAIVRGEVTLASPGSYRMATWEMGPEIELGTVEALAVGTDDVISTLHAPPSAEAACSDDDTAEVLETEILDGSFAEPLLEVAAGTMVKWVNTSVVPHNVVFDDTSIDSSAVLHQDDTFQSTFRHTGEFPYVCTLHPYMKGKVVVGSDDA